jgi:hypothetical protein
MERFGKSGTKQRRDTGVSPICCRRVGILQLEEVEFAMIWRDNLNSDWQTSVPESTGTANAGQPDIDTRAANKDRRQSERAARSAQ